MTDNYVEYSSSDVFNNAIGFLYDKDLYCKNEKGFNTGFRVIDDITYGIQNGTVTTIKDKGTGNTSFFMTLLHNICINKRIKSFVYTDKLSEVFIGLKLLSFGIESKYPLLTSCFYPKELIDEVQNYYKKIQYTDKNEYFVPPLWVIKYYDRNINDLCSSIYYYLELYGGEITNQDRIIFIDCIDKSNIKKIKEVAKELNVPIIVFFSDEDCDSNYIDNEITLEKCEARLIDRPSYYYDYSLAVKNKLTLKESQGFIYLNKHNGFFTDSMNK